MHEHESDRQVGALCLECSSGSATELATFRCRTCIGAPPLCQTCLLEKHRWLPFHKVQRWNGQCFEQTTLAELGFVLRLGHYGHICPALTTSEVERKISRVTVVDSNGLQDVRVQYCDCTHPEAFTTTSRPLQLWSSGLWPSTYERTRTAFSHQSLRYFHHLTMQSKVSAYDYIKTLERLTDNRFVSEVKVCGISFKHVKSLIRLIGSVSGVYDSQPSIRIPPITKVVWSECWTEA